MELKKLPEKFSIFFKKYRYAFLIVGIGLILMLLPERLDKSETISTNTGTVAHTEASVEQRLAEILGAIRGAGKVRVMLMISAGEEVLYQTDEDTDIGEEASSARSDTVTVTDAQRNQVGLVRQVNPPVYKGAVIVCQGGDDPQVRLAVVDAVSKLTGLGANRISVLKMN